MLLRKRAKVAEKVALLAGMRMDAKPIMRVSIDVMMRFAGVIHWVDVDYGERQIIQL